MVHRVPKLSITFEDVLRSERENSLDWTRTSDKLINSQLLYQLSYQGSVE